MKIHTKAFATIFVMSSILQSCNSNTSEINYDTGWNADLNTTLDIAQTNDLLPVSKINCNPDIDYSSACGGNPIGNWKLRIGCSPKDIPLIKFIVGLHGKVELDDIEIAFTDGIAKYELNGMGSLVGDKGTFKLNIKVDEKSLGGESCKAHENHLYTILSKLYEVSCKENKGVCQCVLNYDLINRSIHRFTWAKDSSIMKIQGSNSSNMEVIYCIKGDSLQIKYVVNTIHGPPDYHIVRAYSRMQ